MLVVKKKVKLWCYLLLYKANLIEIIIKTQNKKGPHPKSEADRK
jgi:hypothetical protein